MNKLTTFLALAVTTASLVSCGGSAGHEDHHDAADSLAHKAMDTTAITVDDTTKYKFDFAIANIPSPATSLQELKPYVEHYDNTILNDIKKASMYSTEFSRGFNLGVYNIDMAYAMVNDKGQDVLNYMKDVMIISDALGLRNAVSVMVGQRAENNLNNKDSLFKLLDEIFVKSDSYLRTNERVYTAATVFAGSWLESLYLNCKVSEGVSQAALRAKSRQHLWEQRFHLGNLINLLNDYKAKKECAELIADLKPIHEQISSVKQASDMNDETFKSISDKIVTLRTKMTK